MLYTILEHFKIVLRLFFRSLAEKIEDLRHIYIYRILIRNLLVEYYDVSADSQSWLSR